jgi:hypothetical protein
VAEELKVPEGLALPSARSLSEVGESINSESRRRDLVHSTLMNEGDEKPLLCPYAPPPHKHQGPAGCVSTLDCQGPAGARP